MKRPLQLSLAIALALGVTDAFALGLGAIQVKSGLNQPLVAEIPIIQTSPGESEGLIVGLASVEDFERVGMNRASIGVPVTFTIGKNARGEPVIQVTSTEAVREPFLGILLEANWPKGRLLREYTVLLDPPVMAPAVKGASAVAVATKATEPTSTQPLPESKPAPRKAPVASAPSAPPAAAPKASPAPATPAPAAERVAGGNEYGPVAAGETLGEIARATLPGSDVNVNQMMLALLKNNPNAFFKDNINALKRGAVLRIPNAEEIAASGNAREAAAAVRAQIDEWRGAASSAPTLVADTTPSRDSSTARSGSTSGAGERLALVPPREGKAGQDADDRPGGGRAGGTGDVASKAELARVKEALTSKEQESSELKSRVKDLEDIKGKNEKLINLQSTELAELREKLKQMQEEAAREAKAAAVASASGKDAVTPPAPATTTSPEPESIKAELPSTADATITKDDIWGDAAGDGAGKTGDTGTKAVDSGTPAATLAGADADTNATMETPAGDAAATATAPEASPPAVVEKPVPAVPAKAEPEPAAKKPVAAPVKPAPAATPWYLEPMVLGGAAIGGLLLVILGIFGLRKRKPAAPSPARTSIAGAFGDSPIGGAVSSDADAEEQELIAQVQEDPTNAGSHLELLSLYYAQGATGKFEAAAEEMYAYVADPNEVSWREVRTMGEELCPHNPLFSNQDSIVDDFAGQPADEEYEFEEPQEDSESDDQDDFGDDFAKVEVPQSSLETASMPELDVSDFDLGETRPPESNASADTSFSFDLPPIEEAPAMTEPEVEDEDDNPEMDEPTDDDVSDDEFFAGEDAIGTKLDLAKAYLDMGDPDGARSMLEEVLAEGSSSQQDEARKLISEIG